MHSNLKYSLKQYEDLANSIRSLSIDAVQKANSGHPGMPLGFADVATVLYSDFLKFSPQNPEWDSRDRVVLSAGHGCMLLYALLYLTGYKDVALDEIKSFRQIGSKTSGHPENFLLSGVETTTGPLGQGFANAVGMAIAERYQNSLNKQFSHKTYSIIGDGCLMEGISYEAASLAGHLKLSNLIALFDSNDITIDGSTSISNSENVKTRFESCGWCYIKADGHNYQKIFDALFEAQHSDKPVIIEFKTKIGFGSPNKESSCKSHGSPLGEEEVLNTKKNLGITNLEPFHVSSDVLKMWREEIGSKYKITKNLIPDYKFDTEKLFQDLKKDFLQDQSTEASRISSKKILARLNHSLKNFIGGSADLSGSNGTFTDYSKTISNGNFNGNYIHFGVREHAMAAICNGIALHSNIKTFNSTFLAFYDYMKPSVRLSALMNNPVTYIYTHDSIGLGEDGPTHQPIEQLASLRATPNIITMRPADSIETVECWQIAMESNLPTALILSRQNLPFIKRNNENANNCSKGLYLIKESQSPQINVTIIASGSEVSLALKVQEELKNKDISARVISAPSWELFEGQNQEYKDRLLTQDCLYVGIEAASGFGWHKYLGQNNLFFGINCFGKSAPAQDIYDHFGLSVANITHKIIYKLGEKK